MSKTCLNVGKFEVLFDRFKLWTILKLVKFPQGCLESIVEV